MLFANAVRGKDGEINLALTSLLYALDRYPELDLSLQMSVLDSLAEGARPHVPRSQGAEASLRALAWYLHGQHGFNGSDRAYASPAGCFLNEALEQRTGLPITLSVIYLEVGWRLGLPVQGVGMPGHFLIKHPGESGDPAQDLYCDPFHKGQLLTAGDCRDLLENRLGLSVAFRPEYLAATERRSILYRMLNNLKAMYLRSRSLQDALWATDRMLIVSPQSAQDMRDRGLLHYATGNFPRATTDFLSYLEMLPGAPDIPVIRRQLAAAVERSGLLN